MRQANPLEHHPPLVAESRLYLEEYQQLRQHSIDSLGYDKETLQKREQIETITKQIVIRATMAEPELSATLQVIKKTLCKVRQWQQEHPEDQLGGILEKMLLEKQKIGLLLLS